ncbi:MAG TPA: HAD-IIIC family phosphatase [Patescibacteria group bacterium]|nr:HAD-IIIC family phosphatase [Patescibacteria group bacterium]
MDFLEAHKTVKSFPGGESLRFLMAMSGTAAQLGIFLRAAAAKRDRSALPRMLPFNTLSQTLFTVPVPGETEVFLLLPWDFVPEADWRSGVPAAGITPADARARAESIWNQLKSRPDARFFFLPAPLPPLFSDPTQDASLARWITGLACSIDARLLPAEAFSLGNYLLSGCPVAGAWMGHLAEQIIGSLACHRPEPCKVLVTDLDDTMWGGVVAEEGLEGIHFSPEGIGYRHFLYQTLLSKLRREGALLAAVTRNDPDVALAPLRGNHMVLSEADFVCVLASYHPKSAQIGEIARRLDLGLDSFVFVDDNPVELAEVSAQLPQIHSLAFPSRDDALPALFSRLSQLFARSVLTAEDRDRTDLYRRRLAGVAPSNGQGADLTEFLGGLRMKLIIHDRTQGNRARALQLINKTNQFNLNGLRLRDEEIARAIEAGGRLYGASLEDRTGSHGEIMSCLLMPDGTIESWVMSCRVFQRRAEYAFLSWLGATDTPPQALRFSPTERNLPLQEFLKDPAFASTGNGLVRIDAARFSRTHANDLSLFTVDAPRAHS